MLEKFDKRVLILSLVGSVVSLFVIYNYGLDNDYETIIGLVFGIPILLWFLFDKNYTLGYYILYVITCKFSIFVLELTLRLGFKMIFDLFDIKINSYTGLINFIYFQTFIFLVIGSFITAFLFELFKRKSYLKYENKIISEELD